MRPELSIVHIVESYLPLSQTFIYVQLNAQRELKQAIVANSEQHTKNFPWNPITVVGVPDTRFPFVRGVPRKLLRKVARRERVHAARVALAAGRHAPDVLHAHFGWTGRSAVAATKDLRVPLLTALHGIDVYAAAGPDGDARRHYADLWEHGAAFTCVGPRARDHLISIGCPPERLHIVPVGVDLSQFEFAPSALDRQRPRFLQVARLVEKKGVDTTLLAFRDVLRSIPAAHLDVAGDGPLRGQFEHLTARLGISANVTFHGAIDAGAVRRLTAEANVGLQPSRVSASGDSEGSPTVLIEFQARGLDVVSTRHADIPAIVAFPDELLAENDHAALATAMLTTVGRDPAERRHRLETARSFVEARHDPTAIASQLRTIYETLAARNAHA